MTRWISLQDARFSGLARSPSHDSDGPVPEYHSEDLAACVDGLLREGRPWHLHHVEVAPAGFACVLLTRRHRKAAGGLKEGPRGLRLQGHEVLRFAVLRPVALDDALENGFDDDPIVNFFQKSDGTWFIALQTDDHFILELACARVEALVSWGD